MKKFIIILQRGRNTKTYETSYHKNDLCESAVCAQVIAGDDHQEIVRNY